MFHHHGPKMYGAATIGEKGQVVIPVEARKELGLAPGTRVMIMGGPVGKGLLVVPAQVVEEKLKFFSEKLEHFQEGLDNLRDLADKDTVDDHE